MAKSRKGVIFIPFMVAILLVSAFAFSRHLDQQVDKYAKELKEQKKQEEKIIWRSVRLGPPICFKETLPSGYKTKP